MCSRPFDGNTKKGPEKITTILQVFAKLPDGAPTAAPLSPLELPPGHRPRPVQPPAIETDPGTKQFVETSRKTGLFKPLSSRFIFWRVAFWPTCPQPAQPRDRRQSSGNPRLPPTGEETKRHSKAERLRVSYSQFQWFSMDFSNKAASGLSSRSCSRALRCLQSRHVAGSKVSCMASTSRPAAQGAGLRAMTTVDEREKQMQIGHPKGSFGVVWRSFGQISLCVLLPTVRSGQSSLWKLFAGLSDWSFVWTLASSSQHAGSDSVDRSGFSCSA